MEDTITVPAFSRNADLLKASRAFQTSHPAGAQGYRLAFECGTDATWDEDRGCVCRAADELWIYSAEASSHGRCVPSPQTVQPRRG